MGRTSMERLGKYELIRVLGEGGMGRVYEAVDPMIGRHVAIKTISLNILHDPDVRARFMREAQSAGVLSHPNLITIHDVGEHDGLPYIVMEYLQGQDLSRIISKGALTLDAKLRVMIEVCQGLAYAHARGVIHRDIKPANIFVTSNDQVKIVDFGLARGAISEFTHTGKVIGTLNYMAPEQIKSEGTDTRADIFAAGVVFYELLSGQKAFEGDSAAAMIYKVLQSELVPVHTIDAQLPPRLSEIVAHAIEKDRDARYQTIEALLADIVQIRQEMSGAQVDGRSAVPPSLTQSASGLTDTVRLKTSSTGAIETPARGPFEWHWATAAVVVAAVVALFLVWQWMSPRPATDSRQAAAPVAAAPPAAAPTSASPAPQGQPPDQRPTAPPADSLPAGRQTAPPVAAPSRPAAEPASRPSAAPPSRATTDTPAPPREAQATPAARPEPAAATQEPRASAEPVPSSRPPAEPAIASPPRASDPPPTARAEQPRPAAGAAEQPSPGAAAPAASSPPSPAPSAEAAVQATLTRYKAALESRDIAALKQIWPALVGRQEAAIKMEFENARSIGVEFENVNVRVANAAATITCRRNYMVTTVQGQTLRTATRMTMTLDRRSGMWLIDAIRHEVER